MPDWAKFLEEALKDSPTLVVCLLVIWYAFRHVTKEHDRHIASKDKEIERIVSEKSKLQELVLKDRLTTKKPGK